MRQQMVSNMVLYEYALNKGLQSYNQADRFAPSRWFAPGVLPVFDEDTKDETSLFDMEHSLAEVGGRSDVIGAEFDDESIEDGEVESDSSSYRVLSSKTLADVVEALIGVYYVEGGKNAANHFMKWVGIQVEFDIDEKECAIRSSNVPESILRSVNFDALESALNLKFKDRGLLIEAITHASRPSSGVSVVVKHKLHLHLRHASSALEKQIGNFVKEVQDELSKPGFNSFGLGD